MHIILKRTHYSPYGIEGQIQIKHRKVCETLEHPFYALPQGNYQVEIRNNRRLSRKVPCLLYPESPHGDPMITTGHGPFGHTDGTIVIGKIQMTGLLLHSTSTFNRLMDRLSKAHRRKDPIWLEIVY